MFYYRILIGSDAWSIEQRYFRLSSVAFKVIHITIAFSDVISRTVNLANRKSAKSCVSCAVVEKISTDIERRAVPLLQLSLLYGEE